MPNLDPVTIPRDALDKPERDFYSDLSDEERAAEGLPPREKPAAEKPATEPEKKPEDKPVADKPADEKPPTDEPEKPDEAEPAEEEESPEALDRLFEEIAGISTKLDDAIGEKKPAKTETEAEARLKAALESDDPETQFLAQQLQAATERLDRIEKAQTAEAEARQMAKDDAEFDAVQSTYLVDGKPMTDDHVKAVEEFIIQHPDVGRSLSIEQITRVVFPTAARASKPASPKPRPAGSPNGDGTAVATIVTEGSPGGAAAETFKPRPNETIQSAVQEAGKRFGWTK